MVLSKFSADGATVKLVDGFLGEILPPRNVDGLQPAFFSPTPAGAWGHAHLFKPFGQADNRRGGRLGVGILIIHTRIAALRFCPAVFTWV